MTPKEKALEVLGLGAEATDAEIKKAYHKKALETHPDKEGGDKAKFIEVQKAYETLAQKPTVTAQNQNTPNATPNGPAWKNEHKEALKAELKAFEDKLFAAIRAQNGAFIAANANSLQRISITRLNAVMGNNPIPQNTGTLIPLGNNQVALKQTQYKGQQYQIDYTDANGKTGSAVYDNRGQTPKIMIDLNNPASIQAGVKAAKAAGWPGVAVYSDTPKEKLEEVRQACKEHGLNFGLIPRPSATATNEDKKDKAKEIEPTKADGQAPKQIEAGPSPFNMDATRPPTPK